jgi:beta-lactamase regulating signal transducer with metallopeptidase domain
MSIVPLDSAAALLLDAALRGAVVLAGALAATRLMRNATAASRHLVWTIALAAVLALPVLSAVVPAWKVLPVPTLGRSPSSSHVVTVSSPATPSISGDEKRAAATGAPASTAQSVSPATSSSPSTKAAAPARRSFSFDWRVAVVALWALGGGLVAARLAYGVARVWWMRRRAVEITDESWVRIVDGLARRLRVGRIVTLLREQRASVPMTWGVISPVVLLPAEADAWSDERRTVVLAHELAHVRRWDAATQWIAHLALALFWFNPLVWVAARRLREEREHACDDAVLAIGTRPVAYADHLLDIVRSLGAAEGPVAALAMARRSQFEGRLLAILDGATPRGGVSRGLGLAALVVAAAGLFPLAALRAAEAPAPDALAAAPSTSATSPVIPRTDERQPVAADAPGPLALPVSSTAPRADSPGAVALLADARGRLGERVEALRDRLPDLGLASFGTGRGPSVAEMARTAQDTATLLAVVRELKSDDEKASLLAMVAAQQGRGRYADVARAASEIGSSGARARVLVAVASQPRLAAGDVEAVLRATHGMDSDSEKRYVLATLLERNTPSAPGARRAFFEVVNTFTSDDERRYVLGLLLEKAGLSQELLVDVIRASAPMASDDEKRYVLTLAAEKQRLGAAARDAYLAAARTIDSESERSYTLQRFIALQDGASSSPTRQARPAASTRESRTEQTRSSTGTGTWDSDIGVDLAGGRRVEIHASKVRIGASQTDIRGIARGGSLVVTEIAHGRHRVARAAPAADGSLRFVYTVNGEERPFEGEGRAWMLGIIREFTGSD